jgi:RNA polymerase sigma-70 factor (ECF subfamily)
VPKSADDLLRSVWQETAAELSRLACALGIAPGRAEDVLQEVCLVALGKPPPATDREELRRWLFRVTINRCRLEHRRRSRWQKVLHGLARLRRHAGGRDDPAELAASADEREMVRRALDRLEPRGRTVLVLRYFAELDSREIGKILQMPDSTVRTHLRTARRQLALELKRAGYRDE